VCFISTAKLLLNKRAFSQKNHRISRRYRRQRLGLQRVPAAHEYACDEEPEKIPRQLPGLVDGRLEGMPGGHCRRCKKYQVECNYVAQAYTDMQVDFTKTRGVGPTSARAAEPRATSVPGRRRALEKWRADQKQMEPGPLFRPHRGFNLHAIAD